MTNELREAYFELWAAVENGIDTDEFFKLRETFRGIQSMVEENDQSSYSLECFDGRYFKWDGYILDTGIGDDRVFGNAVLHMPNSLEKKYFEFPTVSYENNQEEYLNGLWELAKDWISDNHKSQ